MHIPSPLPFSGCICQQMSSWQCVQFMLCVACKNVKEMINFILVKDSNFRVANSTNDRMIDIIVGCQISSCSILGGIIGVSSAAAFRLVLCFRLRWFVVESQNLIHLYVTVCHKHCAILVQICFMPATHGMKHMPFTHGKFMKPGLWANSLSRKKWQHKEEKKENSNNDKVIIQKTPKNLEMHC